MSVTLHTSYGDLKCELHCDLVPKTTENFLALCASGYYNDTIFHRNIAGFMVQGGDPTGKGKGGECVWGGYMQDEIVTPTLSHDARGVLSMANRGGKPHTNGSQFFITYDKQHHLDNVNTVFGRVIDGVDSVLDAIELAKVDAKDRPVEKIVLRRVTIHANPLAETQR